MTRRVLVTDCWTRKALSVVRSLGEEGLLVHAVSHTRLGAALYSKYTTHYSILSSPEKNKEKYWRQISEILKKGEFDCIIPLEEETIKVLLLHKEELAKLSKTTYNNEFAYGTASNKWETFKLANELNIPTPHSIAPSNLEEIKEFANENGFPIIFKPVFGRGSGGLITAENEDQFKRILEDIAPIYERFPSYYILQRKLPMQGQGLGVACLVQNGETLVSFSYKRLREFPVKGGPSTLRESTGDDVIKGHAAKLMHALKWTGIAMIEFKHDTTDNLPKLLEINPRFWGSLELAKVSGINFPACLYNLIQGNKIPQQSYEIGVRCRWLFPGDIVHFLANKNRFSMKPSFFNFFDKNTYYDQLSWRDLSGSMATIICTFLSAFDPSTWRRGILR